MRQKFRFIGTLSFSFFMSDSLLAAGKPFRPGRAGVILKIYLLNKVVLVHIFGGGPVYMARTKQQNST